MEGLLESVVRLWLDQHQEAAKIMQIWLDNGVRFGVFCGQAVWIASQLEQSPSYRPDDIDLLVMPQDFELAQSLLPRHRISRRVDLHLVSRDKYDQSFALSEMVCKAGNDTLQFMYPHGPIYCSKPGNYNFYRWHFSQMAFDNCSIVDNGRGAISLAHPFDTLAFYGIMQRRYKNDTVKAASLIKLSEIWPGRTSNYYEKQRSRELGLDRRVKLFIEAAAWRSAVKTKFQTFDNVVGQAIGSSLKS